MRPLPSIPVNTDEFGEIKVAPEFEANLRYFSDSKVNIGLVKGSLKRFFCVGSSFISRDEVMA